MEEGFNSELQRVKYLKVQPIFISPLVNEDT